MSVEDVAQQLLAIEEIKQLKARYFRFLDDQDWSAFRALFCDDAHCEIRGKQYATGDDFVAAVHDTLRGAASIHHGHMPEITITSPSTATGIWMLYDWVEFPPASSRASFHGYARYYEEYRREAEQWKISSLRLERRGETDASSEAPILLRLPLG